jgi:hypothetical protein
MHLKDDPMQNGQLKPAYNVQISTEKQFITHFDFFPNPTDFLTFKPFVNGYKARFGEKLKKLVADSGYGSEENYDFMKTCGIEPFVKFPMFHKEQKRAFKNNGFLAQNLFYNKEKDFFVCPMNGSTYGKSRREKQNLSEWICIRYLRYRLQHRKIAQQRKNTPKNTRKSLVLSKILFFVVFLNTKSESCCLYPQNLKLAA